MAEPLTLPVYNTLDLDSAQNEWDYKNRTMTYLANFIASLFLAMPDTLPSQRWKHCDVTHYFDNKLDLGGTIDWTDCALESLDEVYEECSKANWDGYDAAPISLEAYFEASKLLRIIPRSYPMPDILPEPDGEIGLEWYKDREFSFVISVCGKNIITYVGLFGKNNETYGAEDFTDSVPKVVLNGLKRLFSNE
jgi:hypothetical protein